MFDRNKKFFASNKGKVSDSLDTKETYHQALMAERPGCQAQEL
jgi:hypothetical protein